MNYELPDLPYEYNALEPFIDEATMRLHHGKHHQAYVNGLNKANEKLKEATENVDFSGVKHWTRELAFHGAGHFLHCIFWEIMGPNNQDARPTGELADAINKDFGSFEKFQALFKAVGGAVEASGWVMLVKNKAADKLEVIAVEKHQNFTQWVVEPLVVCDVWEHAYYLKYQNNRGAYLENFFHVINWASVAKRFAL